MKLKNRSLSTPCPFCEQKMEISSLRCHHCDVEVRAKLPTHEFVHLSDEDLHFLRLFIQFEGRIRDMEAPLGLSYPTIRNRIAEFKNRLYKSDRQPDREDSPPLEEPWKEAKEQEPLDVLKNLDQGKMSFEEALKALQARKKEKKK